jgi:uncharacterized protein (TIGR02466 family)
MLVNKKYLWTTPVWEIDGCFDAEFNRALLADLTSEPGDPSSFNIFDNKGPHISKLRKLIEEQALRFAEPHYEGVKLSLRMQRGWVNLQKPGEGNTVHDHGGVAIAAVYYVQTDGAGDLMLVDPRGMTGFGNMSEGGNSSRKYQRVKPSTGKLVLFPGYVLHYVEPNTSPTNRISIATNFWITYGGK